MINCIVIGLGRIGYKLSWDPYREKPCTHTGAILDNSLTRLSAGIDPNGDKRKDFSRITGAPAYPTWESYLNYQPLPGIMFIAVPPSAHGYYLRQALKHSLPVAVVEKPITDNHREAQNLSRLFRNAPTRVVVNHERRFADDYVYVKHIINTEKYGRLLSVHGCLFTGHSSNQLSLLHDGTHLLDTSVFLTSASGDLSASPTTIKRFHSLPHGQKDRSLRFFTEINGYPCYFEIGGKKKFFHFELNLFFEHGKIDIGNGIFREWQAGSSRLYRGFTSLKLKNKSFSRTRYFSNMLKHAVKLYQNPEMKSKSQIDDAITVFKVMGRLT